MVKVCIFQVTMYLNVRDVILQICFFHFVNDVLCIVSLFIFIKNIYSTKTCISKRIIIKYLITCELLNGFFFHT